MAVGRLSVLLGLLALVAPARSQTQMFGHDHTMPEDNKTVGYNHNTLIIPDRNQVIPGPGKLLDVSFNAGMSEPFHVLTLREVSPGTLEVISVLSMGGDHLNEMTERGHDYVTDWQRATFTTGYIPVEGGEVLGLWFEYANYLPYATIPCADGSPYTTHVLGSGDTLSEYQHLAVTQHAQCRRYDYSVPYLPHDNCVHVTMSYSLDEWGQISGYRSYSVMQALMGGDSMCWRFEAPPRPDGEAAVVEAFMLDLFTPGQSQCTESWVDITDGDGGANLTKLCPGQDQDQGWQYSRSNVMYVYYYASIAGGFKGEFMPARESDVLMRSSGGGGNSRFFVFAIGLPLAFLAVAITTGLVCHCKMKNRNKRQAMVSSHPPAAQGYSNQGAELSLPIVQTATGLQVVIPLGPSRSVTLFDPNSQAQGAQPFPLQAPPFATPAPVQAPPIQGYQAPIGPNQDPSIYYAPPPPMVYPETTGVPPPPTYMY